LLPKGRILCFLKELQITEFMRFLIVLTFCVGVLLQSCTENGPPDFQTGDGPYVVVLGIAQDAGYPQAGCTKDCCRHLWSQHTERKMVSCIALIDPVEQQAWMFDATPDFKFQLAELTSEKHGQPELAGIFLTHAHIGHYTGLMHLGHEVMGAKDVPVFAMPRMVDFLRKNGPWSQLVSFHNIAIRQLEADSTVVLNERLKVKPFRVPHRDEYSETVGFEILGPSKSLVFIPDIDKWDRWDHPATDVVKTHDYNLVDGTFYENGEIPGRDMSQIPHPFIQESMELFSGLPKEEKAGIFFIHLNHTNPVLRANSPARSNVLQLGFGIAEEGMKLTL
jgi:pyrroloquinoline quinone biosynthesis protein B